MKALLSVSKLSLNIVKAMIARLKTGNAENKTRASIFHRGSCFGFKWSVERKEARLTVTAERNKVNDRR